MTRDDAKRINDAFKAAEEDFDDDKSTEFLVQIVADRLGIEADDVYEALAIIHEA